MIDCAIIKDLLPLYVDDVLSEESKALISGHIAMCESCKTDFLHMQSEIKKLQPNDETKAEIAVLKRMKHKQLWQKVIVSAVVAVIALAVTVGANWLIFHKDTPIEYKKDGIRIERSSVEEFYVTNDGSVATGVITALDLISDSDFYANYATTRRIEKNGEYIEVMYIYLSQTMFTRWRPRGNEHIFRLISVSDVASWGPHLGINYPSLPLEIYYLVAPLDKIAFTLNDEDFYAQKNDGVLLWSGTLFEE